MRSPASSSGGGVWVAARADQGRVPHGNPSAVVSPPKAACWLSQAGQELLAVLPPQLPLTLLVSNVLANNHHDTIATDDLALIADLLDAGLDLHRDLLLIRR